MEDGEKGTRKKVEHVNALLATLYAAVYGLLIGEDNALILGSLLLFAVLELVMVVTRKVDWNGASGELRKSAGIPVAPPPSAERPS